MMVRRIGSHVLISFNHKNQAESFFSFMKKRNSDAIFLESDKYNMDIEECKNPAKFDVVSELADWILFREKSNNNYVLIDLITRDHIVMEDEDLEEVEQLITIAVENTKDEKKAFYGDSEDEGEDDDD